MLYHYTNRTNVDGIFAAGLRPRGNEPANDHGPGLDSNPEYVYLTRRRVAPWHSMDYSHTAVLVIDPQHLDPALIRPDEDEEKFGTCGTLAYEGVIDPAAIAEVWVFVPAPGPTGYGITLDWQWEQ